MLHADIATLLFATVATSLVLAVALGVAARSRGMEPLWTWAAALLLNALAYALLAARGAVPDLLSVVVANAAFSAFIALWTRTLARMLRRNVHPALLYVPVVLTALTFLVFIDDLRTRIACGNAIWLFQVGVLGYLVARPREPLHPSGRSLLVAAIAITTLIMLLRIVTYAAGVEHIATLTTRSPLQTISFLATTVIPVLASLGFLLMMKEQADRQIEEGKHLLTTIFDSSEESIAMFSRDGALLAINRRGAERFQTTPEKMIGWHLADVMPAEVAGPRVAAIRRVADTGIGEALVDRRAGRTYRLTFYPVLGERERVVAYGADITETLAAEEELRHALIEAKALNVKLAEAQGQLLQSEKMASIGQLAAGVAHELNNPIGFVSSNLGSLESYLQDIFAITAAYEAAEAAVGEHCPQLDAVRALKRDKDFDFLKADIGQLMAESKDGLARVAKIVRDLKDFSRAGDANAQWADLHQGLDSTLNIVWNELKYKCTVKKDYGELPLVFCVPSQLNQVFMNLLVNAAHAIPDKGDITIRTGRQDDQVFVAIADTGSGIAPENLARIFDPFFTTKPVGKGTGLGLSLAYSIVQKHQGRIEVQSEPGHGTTFTVWLPVEARFPAETPA